MTSWVLRDFDVGNIPCQIIEFSVEGYAYIMLFNRIDATRSQDAISDKEDDLGISYRENSYEVKFDLKENFESDTFFEQPQSRISVAGMRSLSRIIIELLNFHYRNSNAEAYFCVAENTKLKRFYDRLAHRYANELSFQVKSGLGDEGLGYEIITPSYKSESSQD